MDLYHIAVIFLVLPIVGGLPDKDIQIRMTTCLHNILQDPDVEIADFAGNPLPNWEIRKFKQVCSNKGAFDVCMSAIPTDDSKDPLVEISEIISKKIDYLCGDGSNYYIKHSSCFAKDDVRTNVQQCSNDFADHYGTAQKTKQTKKNECAVIVQFRKCIAQSTAICGKEASSLASNYMDFNVEPYLGTLNCPKINDGITGGVSTTHFTILNLMLPTVVVLLKTL